MNPSIVIAAVLCILIGSGLLVAGVYWLHGTGLALITGAILFLLVGVLALTGSYRSGVNHGSSE